MRLFPGAYSRVHNQGVHSMGNGHAVRIHIYLSNTSANTLGERVSSRLVSKHVLFSIANPIWLMAYIFRRLLATCERFKFTYREARAHVHSDHLNNFNSHVFIHANHPEN